MLNQSSSPSDSHIVELQDFLTANLLDFFRTIENEDKWMQAAKIVVNQIERCSQQSSSYLENKILFLAHRLKNNVSHISIRQFANDAISAALKLGIVKGEKKAPSPNAPRNLERKATKEIAQAINTGCLDASAAQRAANVLWKQKIESLKMEQQKSAIEKHPLKDVLSVLAHHSTPLAKEDIRNHFLRLQKKTTTTTSPKGKLFSLLEKAQAFSSVYIHKLLGDELFFLCRPIGFLDMKEEIVVIDVPSNAHLHLLSYRKLEILRALKKDPTFFKTKSLRFKVNGAFF